MADLVTRPFRPSDWRDLHAIASHWPSVRQMGSWPWPPSETFTKSRSMPYKGNGFVWALDIDGRVVGSVAITGDELGYMLHPDFSGQGLITRVARDAIDRAFQSLGRDRLVATVWHDNPASYRVLTKLGFVHAHSCYMRGAVRYPSMTYCFHLPQARWRTLSGTAQ